MVGFEPTTSGSPIGNLNPNYEPSVAESANLATSTGTPDCLHIADISDSEPFINVTAQEAETVIP